MLREETSKAPFSEVSLFLRQFAKLFFPTWLISIVLGFVVYEWVGPLFQGGEHEYAYFFTALISAPLLMGVALIVVSFMSVSIIWIFSKLRHRLTGFIWIPLIMNLIAVVVIFIFFGTLSDSDTDYLSLDNSFLILYTGMFLTFTVVAIFRKKTLPLF